MPTTADSVREFLGLSPARPVDDAALASAVAAANGMVAAFRSSLGDPTDSAVVWPPECDQAATMQAAKLYGGRGSVQGIASFQDTGVSVLPSLHPDVQSLLGVGKYQPSVAV